MSSLPPDFKETGIRWFRGAMSEADLVRCDCLFDGSGPGRRLPAEMWNALDGLGAVRAAFGQAFRVVRSVQFEKSAETNWTLPWHQDRVIAVADRHDVPGYGNWSRKRGVWHCEAPGALLDEMLFLRLHLDDCDDSNGAMQIIPRSHRRGILVASSIGRAAAEAKPETLHAKRGDICVLAMLVLHRSGRNLSGAPRRCLRLDMAGCAPASPLHWAAA